MIVHIYKCSDSRNTLNKTLTDEKEITANANRDVDIINPVMMLVTVENIAEYNYIYIPEFQRYYFIESMKVNRTGIYEVNLHEDVLFTYRDKIKECKGLITESNKNVDGYYNNLSIPIDVRPNTKKFTFPNSFPSETTNVLVVVNDRGKTA